MMQWQRNLNSISKSSGDRGILPAIYLPRSMGRHCAGEKLCEAVYSGEFSDSGCIGDFVFFFFCSALCRSVEEGVYIDMICLRA
jgi:hypothetical protein